MPANGGHGWLTLAEVAARIGVTKGRVQHLLSRKARPLPAVRFGRQWMVREADIQIVADRRPGRPKKAASA